MTAPRSGHETMEQIRERGIQLKIKAEEFGQQTRQMADEQLHRAQDSARSYLADAETTAQETLDQVEGELQQAQDQLQEIEGELEEAIDDAQDAAADRPSPSS
jgi:gas vesicle protein